MNIPSKEQRKTLTRSEVSPFFSLILHKGGSAKKDFARSKTKNSSARKKIWRPPPHRKLGKKKFGTFFRCNFRYLGTFTTVLIDSFHFASQPRRFASQTFHYFFHWRFNRPLLLRALGFNFRVYSLGLTPRPLRGRFHYPSSCHFHFHSATLWDIHDRSHRQVPFRFTAAPLRVADLPLLFPLALQPAATPAGARLQLPCILSWLDSTAASRPLPLPVELSLPFPLR